MLCTRSWSSSEDRHHSWSVSTLFWSQTVIFLQDEVQQAFCQSRRQRLSLHLLEEKRCVVLNVLIVPAGHCPGQTRSEQQEHVENTPWFSGPTSLLEQGITPQLAEERKWAPLNAFIFLLSLYVTFLLQKYCLCKSFIAFSHLRNSFGYFSFCCYC